jgi:hypothetical protein
MKLGSDDTEHQVVERLDRISALVYALLHDLAAWLSATDGPVNAELYPDYRLRAAGELPTPAERMARYMNPAVLEGWGPVIERWLAHGYRYRPSFGRNLRLAVTEGGEEGPRAVVSFQDRSEIEVPGGGRQSPGRMWTLTVRVTPDGRQIASVGLQQQS